jgi:hypothetical protein
VADHELRWRKSPGRITRALGAIGVGALVHSLGDQELDAAEPKVVWHTPRSSSLRDVAVELAAEGRDDHEAVGVLTRAAGRHTKELRRAAATIRSEGRHREDLACARADRLLVAAATGRAVDPLTAVQLAGCLRVGELLAAPPDEGFAALVREEPGLVGLAREVRQLTEEPAYGELDDRERCEAFDDAVADRLAGIVARSPAPLVRTQAATAVVRAHLRTVAGLPPPG